MAARRKKEKPAATQANAAVGKLQPAEATPPAEAPTPTDKKPAAKRTSKARSRRKKMARRPKAHASKAPARRKRVAPKSRKMSTDASPLHRQERGAILAAAKRDGLTGAQVQKRFGVSAITYYLWRKKAGGSKARRPAGGPSLNGVLLDLVRREVQSKVREILPRIVREEVAAQVREAFSRR
jgi:hypothetical protein